MNKLHEPEFVADTRNAVGWFFVMGFLTCGLMFVFGGMFSPFFWPWAKRKAKEMAEQEGGNYEKNLRMNKWMFAILLAIWFVVAWAFCIVVHIMDGSI